MEEQKYYWMCLLNRYENRFTNSFSTMHPIEITKNSDETIALINWKEITKEEYDMALNSLNNFYHQK